MPTENTEFQSPDSARISPSLTTQWTSVQPSALARALGAGHIVGLDFIRAMAILLVLAGHASEGWPDGPWVRFVNAAGGLGVESFFVLSGFLITGLLLREQEATGHIDLKRFYGRRAARLLPAFFAYLFLGTAILLVRGHAVPWGAAVSSVFYVINYYQAFTGAQTHFLSHCWSLAVEEQFYLIWPAVLVFLVSRRKNLATALTCAILAIWIYRWILVLGLHASDFYVYRALETRGDHLAIGCLLSVLLRSERWRDRLSQGLDRPFVWFGLAAALCVVVVNDSNSVYKFAVGYMVEPILIALFIIASVIVALRRDLSGWIVKSPLLNHIGKVSYGMYLIHGVIMYSTERVLVGLTGSLAIGFLGACTATIIVASISFRYFELPVRNWINSRW